MLHTVSSTLKDFHSLSFPTSQVKTRFLKYWNRLLRISIKEQVPSVSSYYKYPSKSKKELPFYFKSSKDGSHLYLWGSAPNLSYSKELSTPWYSKTLSQSLTDQPISVSTYWFTTSTTHNKKRKYKHPVIFGKSKTPSPKYIWYSCSKSVSDIIMEQDINSIVFDTFSQTYSKFFPSS